MTRITSSAPIDPSDQFAQQLKELRAEVAELQRRAGTRPASMAWGLMAEATVPGITVTVPTTSASPGTYLTNLITYTPKIGRRYELHWQSRASNPAAVADVGFYTHVVDNTSPMTGFGDVWHTSRSAYQNLRAVYPFAGDGVSRSFRLAAVSSGMPQTVSVFMDQPTSFWRLYDVGPA